MRCHTGRWANHGQLDEHHRPGRLVVAVVGQAAAAVDLDGDVELLAHPPQRVVVRLPQPGQARVGRHRRQQHAGQQRAGLPVAQRTSATASSMSLTKTWTDAGRRPGAGGAEVDASTGCGPAARPSGGRSPPRSAAGRRGSPRRRRAGPCWGTGPRPRCRRPRSPQPAGRVPAAVGRRRLQVGEGVDVGRGPGVELVVPLRGQVVPVLVELGPGVAVRGDDGVALGAHRNSITLAVLRPAGFAISVIGGAAPLRCAASPCSQELHHVRGELAFGDGVGAGVQELPGPVEVVADDELSRPSPRRRRSGPARAGRPRRPDGRRRPAAP